MGKTNNKIVASVIIAAYNSENTIGACVKSVLFQKTSFPFELIVVDDGSTDSTHQKATDAVLESAMCPSAQEATIMRASVNRGPATARNMGVKAARGEIIIFADADIEAPQLWLEVLVRHTDNENIVGGPALSRGLELFRLPQPGYVKALPSCNLAFRKSVLDDIGLFDEDFKCASGEDFELCMRAGDRGYKILYSPLCEVLHNHDVSLQNMLKKARVHGMENVLLRRKRGYTKQREALHAAAKILALPLTTVRRYPAELWVDGFRYELASCLGGIDGLRKYVHW